MRKIMVLVFLIFGIISSAQFTNTQKEIVDVLKYTFRIQISDTTDSIKATAQIKLRLLAEVDSIFLHLKNRNDKGMGMWVSAVHTRLKKALEYKHRKDKVIIFNPGNWRRNGTFEITIKYSGIPEDGLYIKRNKYDKKTFFGDNWPNRAQYWLPVIDHPSDKALVEFFITAPNHFEVVASGKLLSKDAINKNQNRYHFKTKQPIPTKVMVLGAADFKIKQLDTINNVVVSSWIYKESPDAGFDDYRPACSVLKYYDSIIGPYPYQKLANVQSKTRFGGMENAGNIFYYEESVNGKHQVESLVAHELAHQWFGNSVTENNWRDIWLSEGFATYLTDLYLEYKYGVDKLQERMEMERSKVIRYSKNPNVQPIVYDEKDNLFRLLNRNSYEKGAWVLHMLRQNIGDKSFFKLIKEYYGSFKNGNASTDDFVNLTETIVEKDLSSFFSQWLYRADTPKIKMNWEIENGILKVDIQQNENPYELELPIKIIDEQNAQSFILKLKETRHYFEFPTGLSSKAKKIVIDPKVQVLFMEQN